MNRATSSLPRSGRPSGGRSPRRGALMLAALLALPPGTAAADTLRVPADHATIQAAVDAASTGDVVLVARGTYAENLVVSTPGLTIRGAHAVIDGSLAGPCVDVTADGFALRGVALVNGVGGLVVVGDDTVVEGVSVDRSSEDGLRRVLQAVADAQERDTGVAVTPDGLRITGDGATVRSCRLTGIEEVGVSVQTAGPGGETRVERCRFTGPATEGFLVVTGGRAVVRRHRKAPLAAVGRRARGVGPHSLGPPADPVYLVAGGLRDRVYVLRHRMGRIPTTADCR